VYVGCSGYEFIQRRTSEIARKIQTGKKKKTPS